MKRPWGVYSAWIELDLASSGRNRVDQGGMSGGSGGDFVVAGASWRLWEADSFPRSVTHSFNKVWGNSGASILR